MDLHPVPLGGVLSSRGIKWANGYVPPAGIIDWFHRMEHNCCFIHHECFSLSIATSYKSRRFAILFNQNQVASPVGVTVQTQTVEYFLYGSSDRDMLTT